MGLGATTAQAAEFGIYARGSAYIPPCPGDGYVWIAGYQANGYWVPGRWNFEGYRRPEVRGYVGYERGPVIERRFDRDRDWSRDRDRDRDRGDRDRDRDRGHEGYRR
jgi:hypothetical protein